MAQASKTTNLFGCLVPMVLVTVACLPEKAGNDADSDRSDSDTNDSDSSDSGDTLYEECRATSKSNHK